MKCSVVFGLASVLFVRSSELRWVEASANLVLRHDYKPMSSLSAFRPLTPVGFRLKHRISPTIGDIACGTFSEGASLHQKLTPAPEASKG
ncbi:unnamed protein product [Schistocephalus solidus]|uniref:Secreted protein n=1 Tax=Schistocephalus solidus TaxID=70667 RepID=A0A183SPB9_SCHSO|nr:unnamed protein product [Schistocephalus solidus]